MNYLLFLLFFLDSRISIVSEENPNSDKTSLTLTFTISFVFKSILKSSIIPIFFIWGIVLCTFGIVKVIKRKDTKI